MLNILILLYQLLILPVFILSSHFLTLLILPSARYVCSLKSIVEILISNWRILLLKLKLDLLSCVVYKFTCAGYYSVYIGETSRHSSTRVREHLFTDKNSHIFKHLKSSSSGKVFVVRVVLGCWIRQVAITT